MKHYLGICLVLITLTAVCLLALNRCNAAVDHTVESVAGAFAKVLQVQPKVTVNHRVILSQTAPIAELAVVSKEELVTLRYITHLEVMSVHIPMTEKTLTAEAAYLVKAGFDLREPFAVDISPISRDLRVAMPHAKILSVEQIGNLTYKGDDAVLNRVTDAERQDIINQLNLMARSDAEKSTLKADAEKQVAQRLNDLMRNNGGAMKIDWTEPLVEPRKLP